MLNVTVRTYGAKRYTYDDIAECRMNGGRLCITLKNNTQRIFTMKDIDTFLIWEEEDPENNN